MARRIRCFHLFSISEVMESRRKSWKFVSLFLCEPCAIQPSMYGGVYLRNVSWDLPAIANPHSRVSRRMFWNSASAQGSTYFYTNIQRAWQTKGRRQGARQDHPSNPSFLPHPCVVHSPPHMYNTVLILTLSSPRGINLKFPWSLIRNITSQSMRNFIAYPDERLLYSKFSRPHISELASERVKLKCVVISGIFLVNVKIFGLNRSSSQRLL